MEKLSDLNIKFALSNVLESKGRENSILIEWLRTRTDRYAIHPLAYSYANSNYHTRNKSDSARETLIANY